MNPGPRCGRVTSIGSDRRKDNGSSIFNCRQIWTGYLNNYIPDVRLKGDLKIAPGLTSDGHLRIAKATVNSTGIDDARFAVAACLFPHTTVRAA